MIIAFYPIRQERLSSRGQSPKPRYSGFWWKHSQQILDYGGSLCGELELETEFPGNYEY